MVETRDGNARKTQIASLRTLDVSVSYTHLQTNSVGLYVFPSLPPGNYRITVTQPGFQTLVVTDLQLNVATSVTKDLQLTLGSVSQQVQVTTEAPLIETSTTGVGQVINCLLYTSRCV